MSKTSNSIDQKMKTLREQLAWFESDDFTLEEAMKHFASAEKLAKEIEHDLATMKNKIEVVKKSFEQAA